MTDSAEPLGGEFPTPSIKDWQEKAEAALKGAPFDRLKSKTYDGITLEPLYTKADFDPTGDGNGAPGRAPFTRGAGFKDVMAPAWDMRSLLSNPDLKAANKEALRDLERGMTSLHVLFDGAARLGAGDGRGANQAGGGISIATQADLETVLAGVHLEYAPVSLEAGAGFAGAAALMIAAGGGTGTYRFNADPLGTLARNGELPGTLDSALEALAGLAALTDATLEGSRAVTADATPYLDAGASTVQALGAVLATAVAYLRAMDQAGLALDKAAAQISFRLAADSDVFLGIAQLRALRRLWSRVLEACGIDPQPAEIAVETAARAQTGCDPWVNILRGTAASFASAVGGADAVMVRPFDDAVRTPTEQARRVARNTQIILAEESHLARVADPAGGAYLFETLTAQVAEAAWAEFKAIEAEGGMAQSLRSGGFRDRVEAITQKRAVDIAKRKLPITGVSEFPNIAEKDLSEDRKPVTAKAGDDIGVSGSGMAALIEAAKQGASLAALTKAVYSGEAEAVAAFEAKPFAADFEALRDKAKTLKPRIFLANIGPIADHTARATFAKNFFEAGGIETLPGKGFTEAEALVGAFTESGAPMAVLCGSDSGYEAHAESFAAALKAAGCTTLYLAGRPGEHEAAWRAAGVDDFIGMGSNLLEILADAQTRAGGQS